MQSITAEELKLRKTSGEELFILDVREPHEYAETNMGAKLIPLGNIMNMQIDDIEDWREKEIIVHCRSGVRSQKAILMLSQMGFTNMKNLTGGILAWNKVGQ
jgi:rhodanese-related sulfurtransferase